MTLILNKQKLNSIHSICDFYETFRSCDEQNYLSTELSFWGIRKVVLINNNQKMKSNNQKMKSSVTFYELVSRIKNIAENLSTEEKLKHVITLLNKLKQFNDTQISNSNVILRVLAHIHDWIHGFDKKLNAILFHKAAIIESATFS